MADERPLKVQVRGFQDPLVGYISFEAFLDPLEGLEKLNTRPVRGRMASIPAEYTLKASEVEGINGSMTIRFDKGSSQVGKLLGAFDPERPMSIQSIREAEDYSLVVNHEEQY